MNEVVEPSTNENAEITRSLRLPGKIGHIEKALTFISDQRDQASGLPDITSVWSADLAAKAQAVADQRNVPLQTVVEEWEAVWAANG